jgi:glycosyltransferase involved in cell wall biosynthesis
MSVPTAVVEQVRREKARRRAMKIKYLDTPKITFIVHSFNRTANVDEIVGGIRAVDGHELIVCDDGSIDGSRQRWMSHLDLPNDFLILSNDLHEIRILDRAIRFGRAEIICLVQDDDLIPRDVTWVDRVLGHFGKHEKLAIVGGFMGFNGFGADPIEARDNAIWEQGPFRFVHHVNIGPYLIRRKYYEDLGGWNLMFSDVGEPGICFDSELCLRAWLRGYQVGYDFVPFKGAPKEYSLDGGTMLFAKELRFRNQWRNHAMIASMYADHGPTIDGLVESANSAINNLISHRSA